MINVTIFTEVDQIIGYEVTGHANYAKKKGEFDIVCAAVSVLTITIANTFDDFTDYKKGEISFNHHNDGYVKLLIEAPINDQATLLFNTFKLGITGVQQDYKRYIKIQYKEVQRHVFKI